MSCIGIWCDGVKIACRDGYIKVEYVKTRLKERRGEDEDEDEDEETRLTYIVHTNNLWVRETEDNEGNINMVYSRYRVSENDTHIHTHTHTHKRFLIIIVTLLMHE